jgi:mannose-6-phosphate isomerase-like protein (cupin superfamily)
LERIDIRQVVGTVRDKWFNQTLCQVNESVVRLGVIEGDFHWHKHDHEAEFFYVVDGKLLIDLEGRTVELTSQQGFVVPQGLPHRTRAPARSVILMVERRTVVPTGDA